MNKETILNAISAVTGGLIGAFLGGWDGFLYSLVTFVVIDYITGVLSAIKNKALSSEIGFWGLVRKVLLFALVGVAHILDANILGTGSTLRTALIFFFLSNEGLSIIENTSNLGVPISTKLIEVFQQLQDKSTAVQPKKEAVIKEDKNDYKP